MPRVSHILETSLYVDDLARSRDFYARVFGFSAVFEDGRMCVRLVEEQPAGSVAPLAIVGGGALLAGGAIIVGLGQDDPVSQ